MLPEQSSYGQKQQPESNVPGQIVFNPLQNFLLGAFLSGLPIFVYLSLSMEMTHTRLAAVGNVKLAVAIAVPVLCGLLAAIFKQRVIKVLTGLLESVHLPF